MRAIEMAAFIKETGMTKDVLVKVSGVQFDLEDEPIELVTGGTYYLKNGKHYVLYEEQPEMGGPVIRNIVKFRDGHFEMTKKGGTDSYLVFDKGESTSTFFQTPVGPMKVSVVTHDLLVTETEEELHVKVNYSLNVNYNYISECEVNFKVQAR